MTSRAAGDAGRPGFLRELLVAWLHLSVLWAFAFARPLFQVLEDGPEFFVARGNTSLDIVALALAVTFLPPTLLCWARRYWFDCTGRGAGCISYL